MALISTIDSSDLATRLEPWLAEKLAGEDVRVSNVVLPHSSGMSSETVLFDLEWHQDGEQRSQKAVARVAPSGEGLFISYDLSREAAAMDALYGADGVPVPRVLFSESDPSILGAPFFVMERVDGEVPGDDPPFTVAGWVAELSAAQRGALYDNGLKVLAAIHDSGATAPAPAPDQPASDSGDLLDQQLTYWETFFTWATEGLPNPTIEAGLKWLKENRPTQIGEAVLSWGDARLGNLVFDDDQAVTGVLDWEMATAGPRELDLAWWLFIVRHHTEGIGAPLPSGFPDAKETVRRYEELTGYAITDLPYYEVFAATKLGILVLRAARLLIAAGALPPDATMGVVNPATVLLAQQLDLPVPQGDGSYYIGNR